MTSPTKPNDIMSAEGAEATVSGLQCRSSLFTLSTDVSLDVRLLHGKARRSPKSLCESPLLDPTPSFTDW